MTVVVGSKPLNDKYAQSKSALELVKGAGSSGEQKKRKANFTSRVQDQSKKGTSTTISGI
jgi:hypothetical protein